MAAFSSSTTSSSSSFHPNFLLRSVFPTNSSININLDHHHNTISTPTPTPTPLLHQSPNSITCLNFSHQALAIHNPSSMDNNSSSILTDHHNHETSCEQLLTQNLITPAMDNYNKKRKPSANSAQSKDKRELVKGKKQKKMKSDEEKKNNSKENKGSEEAAGYIHVRARRGQATDSHSLAERVRRERISERMKLLQHLVPGCDKVTGKALMLDEIINYVQSLQNQVEFLSMKLASMNPMFYDFGVDLESFMVRPHQDLGDLPSPLPSMQQCSPTATSSYNYNFLENSANPILFQQSVPLQPQVQLMQGSRQGLWEVDEHRQKIINQSGFNNSLFSFH